MDSWLLPFLATVAVNLIVVAYLFGRLSAKVEAVADLVKKLCGDHTDIAINKADIAHQKEQIAWGSGQFEALWRAVRALNKGEKVRDYDPIDPAYPNRSP